MNSIDQKDALLLVEEIMALMDENYLSELINEPIYKAASNFEVKFTPNNFQTFIKVLGDFINHIHAKGVYNLAFSPSSKFHFNMESIIANFYHEDPDNALYQAYLDAVTYKIRGIESILSSITETMILKYRKDYIRSVFLTHFYPMNWYDRSILAEVIIKKFKKYFPAELTQKNPRQLAAPETIQQLIELITLSKHRIINHFHQIN